IDLLMAQDAGEAYDSALLARRVRESVAEIVAKQVETGIDVVSDGEMGKVSYVNYLKHRLAGFGEPAPLEWTPADLLDHPGFLAGRRPGGNCGGAGPPRLLRADQGQGPRAARGGSREFPCGRRSREACRSVRACRLARRRRAIHAEQVLRERRCLCGGADGG